MLEARVSKLERAVDGDGNGSPGLRIRVDRLEQSRLSSKDRMALYVGPIVTGLIVMAGEVLFMWKMGMGK